MCKIKIKDISNLRKMTGSNLMDCKNALIKESGDLKKAFFFLKKKNKIKDFNFNLEKINNGVVISKTNDNCDFGVILFLASETDFVAKNKLFINTAEYLAKKLLLHNNCDFKEFLKKPLIKEKINEIINLTNEKISIKNIKKIKAPFVSSYTHNGNKIASLVGFSKIISNINKIGLDISMQVAAMSPIFINEKELSYKILKEKLYLNNIHYNENDLNYPINKIKNKKLKSFINEKILLNQKFIKNINISVKEYLENINNEINIINFERLNVY